MSTQPPTTCDDIQPWLAAHALGEAEDDPAARAHLQVCPRCQGDLSEYRRVAGALCYAAPLAAPAPDLRGRIVDAVTREVEGAPAVARPRPPEPIARKRRMGFTRPTWAAFAFAALAVALLVWNVALQRQVSGQAAELAFHRQSWKTMVALLNDSSVKWYAVAGGGASGHVWATPAGRDVCFVAQGLPAQAEGQVLQVWLAHGSQVASGGTFVSRDGGAWVLFKTDEPLGDYESVFVTIEPAGGSAAPSGPRVMDGSLAVAAPPSLAERHQVLRLLGDRAAGQL